MLRALPEAILSACQDIDSRVPHRIYDLSAGNVRLSLRGDVKRRMMSVI